MRIRRGMLCAALAAPLLLVGTCVLAQRPIQIGEINSYKAQPTFLGL